MAKELHKIIIESRSYGDLSGVAIYLTDDLYKSLGKQKARDGTPILKLLKSGRAVQGLKHLITIIREHDKKSRIIFTKAKTKKIKGDYYINYDDYRSKSQARFFPLYRERGLDTANYYMNSYFPQEFHYEAGKLKESELKKVDKQLSQVLSRASEKEKNQIAIIEEATRSTSRLRRKTRRLNTALADLQKQSSLYFYREDLDELKIRLTKDLPETRGKDSWQKWIYKHNWLFGIYYLSPPIQKEKVGFDNIPDFLFATLDGFIDILEIKKPSFDVVIEDPSHAGSYSWCPETNTAIGQTVNYIQQVELNQLQLVKRINHKYKDQYQMTINVLKPRALILIGDSSGWKTQKKEAFRTLNYSLHGIEVLTYSDLISRGESIILMLERK
jgi:hypothetical protein